MSESWAAIIAALIGVLGTILVTKFDDVMNLFRGSSRKITGEWKGYIKIVNTNQESFEPLEIDYIVSISQTGNKIKGTMIETQVSGGREPLKHTWKGKLVNDYITLDVACDDPSRFLIAAGVLHISATGDRIRGYYAANAGAKAPSRTLVGYTELERRSGTYQQHGT